MPRVRQLLANRFGAPVRIRTPAPTDVDMAAAKSAPERVARAYLDVWNERAYAEIPGLVSESFVMHDPTAPADPVPGPKGEVHGPDGLETFIRGVVAGFPDFEVTVRRMLSDDGVVTYDGELAMSHEGTFYGVPPTGRRAEVRYMGMITVVDGLVEEHRVYPPVLAIADQLGFTSLAVVPYLPRLAWGLLRRRL
jgi:predicted ester cyclase